MKKTYTIGQTLEVEDMSIGVEGPRAYRATLTDNQSGEVESWEGICPPEDLPTPKAMHPEGLPWYLVPPEALEEVRLHGLAGEDDNYGIWEGASETPYTDLKDPDCSLFYSLVRMDHGDHLLFDRENRPLPVARHCDYSPGYFDNAHYDLTKAMAHLEKLDCVKDLTRERIPSYNAGGGRNETLSFRFTPDVDMYRAAIKRGQEIPGRSIEFFQAIFDLDLLGLRECGAALHDEFYPGLPTECPDDDEGYY